MDIGPESDLIDVGTLSLERLRSSADPALLESMRLTVQLADRAQVWTNDGRRAELTRSAATH